MKRAVLPLLLFFAACAGPRVALNRSHDFSKTKRMAVASFNGPSGDAAADALAQELLFHGMDVVERRQLEKVIQEQSLGASGLLDPRTITRIGRILGVDAIFFGTVSAVEPPRSFLVAMPAEGEGYVRSGASELSGGMVYSRGPVGGVDGALLLASAATASVTARLVDVETGSLLWSASQSWEGYDVLTVFSSISKSFAKSLPMAEKK